MRSSMSCVHTATVTFTWRVCVVCSWARRKQALEGRFSGRLPTKEDERRLGEEVSKLAPLLGGSLAIGCGEGALSA